MTIPAFKNICFYLCILIFACISADVRAQLDREGNQVFKSKTISKEKLKYYQLTSNYYSISENISNIGSPAYVSDAPTTAEYIRFALDVPAHSFICERSGRILYTVTLKPETTKEGITFSYNILEPYSGKSLDVPCTVKGEIAEKRVAELKRLNVMGQPSITHSLANDDLALLYGVSYAVQPYEKMKAEMMRIINHILVMNKFIGAMTYIRQESVGGDLDFEMLLADEEQFLFTGGNASYKKKDYATYLWGQKVKTYGVKSSKKAVKLWQKLHWRKLEETEKKALIAGFESGKN